MFLFHVLFRRELQKYYLNTEVIREKIDKSLNLLILIIVAPEARFLKTDSRPLIYTAVQC